MPTTNLYQRIPALIHGISRQSPTIRFPGQVNDALNVNLDVVDGARKRSGTKHVAFIAGAIEYNGKYKCHRIRRDNEEQYLVVIGPTGFIRVVDVLTGNVVTPTTTTNAANYLSYAGASANDIRMVTIADTTFIVNTKVPTETTDSTNTQLSANRMPIKMQRTSTSPLAFSIDTVTWKQRPFYRQIIKKSGTAPTSGTFKLTYLGAETPSAIPFNAKASGTQMGTLVNIEGALVGDGTSTYPGIRTLTRGKIIVSGGPLPERDVVVDFSPDLEVSSLMTVTSSTLAGGSYTVVRGDDETQPAPQFVIDKRPISDIGYFRNRLILVADDYIQFSAADDLFMMFKERADVIVDSDPFTLQLSANDVTIIDNIVPFRKSVLVLTESGQQFEVTSGDVFGPGQVAVTASTKYQTKPVRPVAIGERIYMLGQHPTRSILYEYYYSENAVSNIASDVSKHVDGLIPASAIALDASENSDMVVVVAAPEADYPPEAFSTNQTGPWDDGDSWNGGESPQPWDEVTITNTITFLQYPTVTKKSGLPATEIFVYKSYTVGQERKQSAWARWAFGNDNIQSLAVFDDELYIIRRDDEQAAGASGLFIEKMAMTDQKTAQDGWPYQVQIDHQRMFAAGTGTYNAGNNTTSWVLGYSNAAIDVCVLTNMSTVPIVSSINGTVTVSGNYSNESVMLGRRYSAELELSKVLFRPDDKPVTEGKTTLTKMVVDHVNSGSYQVETTRVPANTTASNFVPAGGLSEYGKYTAWITTDADRCEIKLKSDSVYPVTWSGLEYHGTFATLREFKQ